MPNYKKSIYPLKSFLFYNNGESLILALLKELDIPIHSIMQLNIL